jgi:hypothetical protein
VSQLHARAIQRLRKALGADSAAGEAAAMGPAILAFQQTMKRRMAKIETDRSAVVLPYKAPAARPVAKITRRAVSEPRVAAAR